VSTAAARPPPPIILQSLLLKLNQYVTPELVNAVLARGVAEHLNSKQALKQYFMDLLSGGDDVFVIIIPLLQGLQRGPPHIDARVTSKWFIGVEDKPALLHWASQCRLLKIFGWTSQDEMVEMIIRAGANVNAPLKNKTSPIFFAVKRGTLETVDLLLAAGGNIEQRDNFGRTCLHNALEHPSPPIVKRLLEYFSATETFEAFRDSVDGVSCTLTMPDRIHV
jgi:hypothetical protein